MKMNNKFERIDREDVISVYSGQILVNNRTFTVSEFILVMMSLIREKGGALTEEKEKWFAEGVECKILKPGAKRWQRGQVRLSLEFTPEALEDVETTENDESSASKSSSPLDDIRQMMPKNN
ncbi:MAG: hypothetical protein JOZ78_08120 [Chroococcidiopsidaceae cyanobacterium CP_BM_ER_R8_30]|nr:hypothetical protein [Chroococcidiopsidaceae cyanobacterium CP_BM_ER_R8_30]